MRGNHFLVAGLVAVLTASILLSQEAPRESTGESPYVGIENRAVKSLSEQQIEDYLQGRGMGFALAAELNGYPGPKHVLELADELGLRESQRESMEAIFEAMRSRAIQLGREIVDRERELDAAFADGTIEAEGLERAAEELGRLNGRLRAVHLAAHLEAVEVLDAHQRMLYSRLRGYEDRGRVHDPSKHHG